MLTVGLTGNFGMGKSTVLKLFSDLGAYSYDVDSFVHDTLKRRDIIDKITDILGSHVITAASGERLLDKKAVSDIIFSDPEKRKEVENTIHPEVLKAVTAASKSIQKESPSAVIVYEVPLLFESGYDIHFDKTVVVYCSIDTALHRLSEKGFTRDKAEQRLQAQMPVEEKKGRADIIISNDGEIQETASRVKEIYRDLASGALTRQRS